jgi:hypothetical protein
METHTFPIAEPESKKLDHVKEELRDQPFLQKTKDFFRSNPDSLFWPALVVIVGLGIKLFRNPPHYRLRRRLGRVYGTRLSR